YFKAGDRIPVGAVLVSFADGEEQAPQTRAPTEEERTTPSARQRAGAERGARAREEAAAEPPERAEVAEAGDGRAAAEQPKPPGDRVLATPATRRRARELGIDLAEVQGTGPGGRITPEDLERWAQDGRR